MVPFPICFVTYRSFLLFADMFKLIFYFFKYSSCLQIPWSDDMYEGLLLLHVVVDGSCNCDMVSLGAWLYLHAHHWIIWGLVWRNLPSERISTWFCQVPGGIPALKPIQDKIPWLTQSAWSWAIIPSELTHMAEPFGVPASCETLAALFLSPITAGQICNIACSLMFKVWGLFFFFTLCKYF